MKYRSSLYKAIAKWTKEESSSGGGGNVSGDPVDSFQLYISSTGGSSIGCPFMARNKTGDHAVFITDTMVAIDHCNPTISDEIERHYKDTGRIIAFPMRAVKDFLKARLNEYYFYINYDILEGKISRIEFGLNHEDNRNGRCYFFDGSLNLMPVWEYSMETYHVEKQAIDDVLSTINQTPLRFLSCFEA